MKSKPPLRDDLQTRMLRPDAHPVHWHISDTLVPYDEAICAMEARAAAVAENEAGEQVWLVEHPSLFTAGTSANDADLLDAEALPVFQTGRGGEYTYHGPGQRICYCMMDLSQRGQDIRRYVATLEQWVINTLAQFNITGERRHDRVGVWVARPEKPPLPDGSVHEDKIAAIGIRVRKWVTYHGISINLEPELSHYEAIVPCGVKDHGVTSLVDLGIPVSMNELDSVLRKEFEKLFGATV